MKSVSKEQLSAAAVRNRWSVEKPNPAPQPFNTLSAYTQGGDEDWVADAGGFAHSGEIGDEQESWMYIDVNGPGTVRFDWKVSSEEDYDYLEFYHDEIYAWAISGQVDWAQKSLTIGGMGACIWSSRRTVAGISAEMKVAWPSSLACKSPVTNLGRRLVERLPLPARSPVPPLSHGMF